jgi:hypothetical protein
MEIRYAKKPEIRMEDSCNHGDEALDQQTRRCLACQVNPTTSGIRLRSVI